MSDKLAKKLIVLGVDGMDPRLARKYLDKGVMPNLQRLIDIGASRQDLVLLGAHPTITPPMWTTLATGAYPNTHGITCFWRQVEEEISAITYNLDSRKCLAEQIWNVTTEAGKKTLVWHWPGSSWPPSSDSPLLHVVDGTQPAGVSLGVAGADGTYVVEASPAYDAITRESRNWYVAGAGCVIEGLEVDGAPADIGAITFATTPSINIMLSLADGEGVQEEVDDKTYIYTPLRDAEGWANAPEGAKEFPFTVLGGHINRWALVTKNEQGIYDTVSIYYSKDNPEPITTLVGVNNPNHMVHEIYDLGEKQEVTRSYNIIELAEDGSKVRLMVPGAYNIAKESSMFYPESIFDQVVANVGYVPGIGHGYGKDPEIVRCFHLPIWSNYRKWQGDAINALIRENEYDVVFSHLHNIDALSHNFWMYCKNRPDSMADESVFQGFMEEIYIDTDEYFGQFMHLLDEGWSIVVVSDHGLAVREENHAQLMGDPLGVNARIMWQLGYTALVQTEDTVKKEIDWTKTKAVATRGNYIWINVKGRNQHVLADGTVIDGIVDPADKYAVEEQIMQDLLNYRDSEGNRVIALIMRNKDAAILGLNGPHTGDLVYWCNEGATRCHGDCLSTTYGYTDTSVSPIFVAAGAGFKHVITDRVIRQVDVTPTICSVLGIRQPAQAEGSIVHQILEREIV